MSKNTKCDLRLLPCVVVLLAILSLCLNMGARSRWDKNSDKRKADYFYLEALSHDNVDEADAAVELLERAYRLNPDDPRIGYDYALKILMGPYPDSTTIANCRPLIERYTSKYPDDYEAAVLQLMLVDYFDGPKKALEEGKGVYNRFSHMPALALRYVEMLTASGERNNLNRAAGILDSLIEVMGWNQELLVGKSMIHLQLEDTAQVVRDMDRYIGENWRSDEEVSIFKAKMNALIARPDTALFYYNYACSLDSTSTTARVYLADFYLAREDTLGYCRECKEILRMPDLDNDDKLSFLEYFSRKHLQDSTLYPVIDDLYTIQFNADPGNIDLHQLYANYLMAINRYKDAATHQRIVVDANPSDTIQWSWLGEIYELDERYDDAINLMDEFEDQFPGLLYPVLNKGKYYMQLGKTEDAIGAYREALEICDPTDTLVVANLHAFIGDLWQQIDNYKDAAAEYETSMSLDPDNALVLNNYAYLICTSEGGDLDRAQELVEKSLQLDDNNLNSYDTYAWILFKKKDYAKALEMINKGFKIADKDKSNDLGPEIYSHAGDIYFMNGYEGDAISFWEKGLSLDPDNALLKKKVANKTYFEE